MAITTIVNQKKFRWIGICFLQIVLTGLAILFIFKPWLRDWSIPFNYQGDTIFQLILIKSIANSGWTWFIPDLSAPMSGFNAIAFPQNISFSWALMKVISLFTKAPGLILNLFWLGSMILTSLTCLIALRIFKTPSWLTIPLATLYALLPYALLRNTTHISLTYIFTPIIAAYAIGVISRSRKPQSRLEESEHFWPPLLWVSCAAIGLDYIYTAFFSCCFLMMAALLASFDQRSPKPFRQILTPLIIIIVFTFLNLAPTIWAWSQDGVPPNMGYKSYADVEVYGLKIRHLVSSPALLELIPSLGNLQYPLENENKSAMLGILGGLGYIAALLYGMLGHQVYSKQIWGAGALTIAGTLLGTIGGLGAVLSYVIGPDIRAYNRVSPFLAFFSFFILAHLIFLLVEKTKHKLGQYRISPIYINSVLTLVLSTLFVGALIDQSYAVKPLLHRYLSDQRQVQEEQFFIHAIESRFPQLTHFYQLPETPFPVDAGTQKMGPYDHGRPFLWSHHLQWSWPNFSLQGQMWLRKIGDISSKHFLENLANSRFNAIWLDRQGFNQSSLQLTEGALRSQLGEPVLISEHGRYAIYSLEPLLKLKNNQGNRRSSSELDSPLLNPVGIDYAEGFYPQEFLGKDKTPHYWAQNSAELKFYNFSDTQKNIEFHALLSYNSGGMLSIQIKQQTKTIELKPGQTPLSIPLELAPHSRVSVKLKYDGPPVQATNDPRQMYLSFSSPFISITK